MAGAERGTGSTQPVGRLPAATKAGACALRPPPYPRREARRTGAAGLGPLLLGGSRWLLSRGRAFRPNEAGAAHGSLPARPEKPLNIEPSRPAGPPVPAPNLARLGKAEERSANAGKGRAKSPASAAIPARATESSARPARTLLRRRDPVGEGASPTPIERGFPDPPGARRLSRGEAWP